MNIEEQIFLRTTFITDFLLLAATVFGPFFNPLLYWKCLLML